MQLFSVSKYVFMDELPPKNSSKNMCFFSCLLNKENFYLPKHFPSKIFTSKHIMEMLVALLSSKNVAASKEEFVILEPNIPMKIKTENSYDVEVVLIECDSLTGNSMYLFKCDGKLAHLYAGTCNHVKNLYICDNIIKDLIQKQIIISNLYIDITAARSTDYSSTETAINEIKKIKYNFPLHQLRISIPVFGYEDLIARTVREFPKYVYVNDFIRRIFEDTPYARCFANTQEEAIIYFDSKILLLEEMKSNLDDLKQITIKIIPSNSAIRNVMCDEGLYQVKWSPYPSPFILQFLVGTIIPQKVFPIIHLDNYKCETFKVPKFLQDICLQGNSYDEVWVSCKDIALKSPTEKKHCEIESTSAIKENANIINLSPLASKSSSIMEVHQADPKKKTQAQTSSKTVENIQLSSMCLDAKKTTPKTKKQLTVKRKLYTLTYEDGYSS